MCDRAHRVDGSRPSSSLFVKDFRHSATRNCKHVRDIDTLSGCSILLRVNLIGHPARPPSEDGYPRGETVKINSTLAVGASVLALTAITSFATAASASPVYRPYHRGMAPIDPHLPLPHLRPV